MKIIAITQARMGSSRLPGKVMKTIAGKSLLRIHIERILRSRRIDKLIVATTTGAGDSAIVDEARRCEVDCFQGSESDVLDRFYQAVSTEIPDYVIRLTADCPLIDPVLVDEVVDAALVEQVDYVSNTLSPTYPDGQDCEVFRFSALARAWERATLASDREHVTPYIWRNSEFHGGDLFTSRNVHTSPSYESLRMTIDEPQDFELIKDVIEALGEHQTWRQYADYISNSSHLNTVNHGIERNEGYRLSLESDG